MALELEWAGDVEGLHNGVRTPLVKAFAVERERNQTLCLAPQTLSGPSVWRSKRPCRRPLPPPAGLLERRPRLRITGTAAAKIAVSVANTPDLVFPLLNENPVSAGLS